VSSIPVEPEEGDFASVFAPPEEQAPPVVEEPFPDEWKLPFQGLLLIGKLEGEFDWLGHHFLIRTLTTNEILEVGLVTARYQGSSGESWAYMTAIAGTCLVSIDRQPMPFPMVQTGASEVQSRFDWARTSLYQPAIEEVYKQFAVLQAKVDEVVAQMGKSFGSTAG